MWGIQTNKRMEKVISVTHCTIWYALYWSIYLHEHLPHAWVHYFSNSESPAESPCVHLMAEDSFLREEVKPTGKVVLIQERSFKHLTLGQ